MTPLQIRNSTVIDLMDKIFQNYNSWCRYLHLESNIRSICISFMCILFLKSRTSLTKRSFKSQNPKGCLHTTARASLHRAVFTDLGWSFKCSLYAWMSLLYLPPCKWQHNSTFLGHSSCWSCDLSSLAVSSLIYFIGNLFCPNPFSVSSSCKIFFAIFH